MLAAAALPVLVWLALLTARGGFWRADQRLPARVDPPEEWPEVVALIPARDEAGTIGAALESHARSAYPGRLSVTVVDDGSRDGTAGVARRVADRSPRPIRVLAAPPLPAGWTGKLWALETGFRAVADRGGGARYLLLTDADIVHAPDTLARLVALAERDRHALVSLMARLDARGVWGPLLIPAFVFFFQKLYPFAWVNDPARSTAAAAGGCILLRRETLSGVGGFGAIRGALIDDCALAARIKREPSGGSIWLGLAQDEVISLRDNTRFATISKMVARTAFAQLRHSVPLLIAAAAGMVLAYLLAPALVLLWPLHREALVGGLAALAWALMSLAYLPTLRLYARPAWEVVGLPLAAFLYLGMTIASALAHWRGRGGAWKGRTY